MYHVETHFLTTIWLDKFLRADFYFYEYLTGVYKRGFFELHLNFCQLIKNPLFGPMMKQRNLTGPCPYPPGEYHFYNMTVAGTAVPKGFPFTKGRLYANATYKNIFIASGYLDIEIKEQRTITFVNQL
ncbi:hypothetical protein ABMA28_003232 [Loxostege sticticalis]|uniref:Uncharacterized protein n=1 Tax=Loxostege sticticalis TaxID=481309 RepID=A0ABD0SVG9_LOXSC